MEAALKLNKLNIDEQRVKKLKDYLLDAPQKVDNERLKMLAEIYPKLDGLPSVIRRAKLYEYILENKTLYIDDNYFVGSVAQYVAGVYAYPEWACGWMKDMVSDKGEKARSHLGEMSITDEDRQTFSEIVKYWDDKCIYNSANKMFEEVYGYSSMPAQESGLIYDGNSWPAGGGNANYARVLNQGLGATIAICQEKLESLEIKAANREKRNFYQAAIISMRAIVALAHRYAELARKMAADEKNFERRQELLEVADMCDWVPENPARNLREAMQSFLLTHLALQIEVTGCGYSLGYLGQEFESFYQKDLAAGATSREEALYLMKMLFIKIQEIGYFHGPKFFKAWSAHVGQTLSIGGLTADGLDATAEMDYIIMDAHIDLKNIQPPLALFWHAGIKEDFMFKAIDVIKTGIGHPQIMNTNVCIPRVLDRFKEDGATIQEARRVAIFGCVGTDIASKTAHPVEGELCIAKALELAMNNGTDPVKSIEVGPKTGNLESFKSFDELWDAWVTQVDFGMKTLRAHGHVGNMIMAESVPLPFRSVLTDGCLEKGADCWNGGAQYTADLMINVGTIDTANSLMAIKKLVFEDKKITMKQLKEAIDANFEGYEEIHRLCIDAPKHGNDEDEMNALVRSCYEVVYDAYMKIGRNFCGKMGKPEAYSNSLHNSFGAVMGALPEGREAGRALTDGSVSALPGSDVNGPTALVNSAAKALDTIRFNSNHFNMKFHPTAVETPQGVRNLLNLMKTYFDQGGSHIQFNIVSSETLKDAQLNPEKHKDLVVRVAGFSAYFTRLDPGVQTEIIKRTELTFA